MSDARFERCGKDVKAMVLDIVAKHHAPLEEASVTFDLLFKYSEDGKGGSLKLHGYPAAAVVRNIGVRDRAKGCADIEIIIDGDGWIVWSEPQQRAVLDHQIMHVELVTMRDKPVADKAGRPKTKIRLHDWQLGGFQEIARRYKIDSIECWQAKQLMDQHGQFLFNWKPKERKS